VIHFADSHANGRLEFRIGNGTRLWEQGGRSRRVDLARWFLRLANLPISRSMEDGNGNRFADAR